MSKQLYDIFYIIEFGNITIVQHTGLENLFEEENMISFWYNWSLVSGRVNAVWSCLGLIEYQTTLSATEELLKSFTLFLNALNLQKTSLPESKFVSFQQAYLQILEPPFSPKKVLNYQ